MMGLDLTNQTVCTGRDCSDGKGWRPCGELFSDIMNFTLSKRSSKTTARLGGPVHDATCIGYLINPDGIKTREMYVEVDVNSGPAGRTVCDELGVLGKPPIPKSASLIDTDWFCGLVEECVRGTSNPKC